MEGQDEMTDILAESYPTNIKRTFAGLSINGCMKMMDSYGADGINMADTWTVFGDPAIMVRTDNPGNLVVTHDPAIFVGSTSLTVTCNVNGARVTATLHDTILATTLVQNNIALLTFPGLPSPNDSLHITVTAYNYIPYISDIPVITASGPYILFLSKTINDTTGNNNHLADYGEDILLTLFLKNVGMASSGNLSVKVRTVDPFVSVIDSTENYGIFTPNEVKNVKDGFSFHASSHIPDGHNIPFNVISSDDSSIWSGTFSITAHAPVLSLGNYILNDSTGNHNGRLDPGETAFLKIFINNEGSADAFDVVGHLVSVNPNVTIVQYQLNYGDLPSSGNAFRVFTVIASSSAQQGETAPFALEISAQKGISGFGNFDLVIGKIPVLIVDYDGNTNSAPQIKTSIEGLGLMASYMVDTIPVALDQYSSIFVSLGIYADNHVLSGSDGQRLANYLNSGGRLYMEGGDTWFFDPPTPVHPMFHISGLEDGGSDLGTISGIAGTFTDGMTYLYSGDNQYVDRISAITPAFNIFHNGSPVYFNAVANDGGGYKTIGSSFEFGGLADTTYPSTKIHLMEKYLNFFGIQIPALNADFIGYPTFVNPGSAVSFIDFSTGPVTGWNWSFPGGTPSSSTDKNPLITYNHPGTYDVQLVISGSTGSDTLFKTGYIVSDYPTGFSSGEIILGCSLSPNPNKGRFTVTISSFSGDQVDLQLFNMLGNSIYQEKGIVVTGRIVRSIEIPDQTDGIYFLTVKGKESVKTIKVVVKR